MNQNTYFTSNLYPGAIWNKVEKVFYRLKSDYEIDKKIFPNEDGFMIYLCSITKKQVKKKSSTFLYEFFNEKLKEDQIVVFKDLNSTNYVPENIFVMQKSDYKILRDSIDNLEGAVKIKPHKTDAFSFIVYYKMNQKTHKKTCHDIVTAQRIKKIILYKSSKFLNKHIVTR